MRPSSAFAVGFVATLACNGALMASSPGDGGPSNVDAATGAEASSPFFDGGGGGDASPGEDASGVGDATLDVVIPPWDGADALPPFCGPSYPTAPIPVNGDAGSPPASLNVACCTPPGPRPVTFSVVHGASPLPDGGPMVVAVPDGYAVSLNPTMANVPAGATLSTGTFSISDLTDGIVFPSTTIGPEEATFMLPPGVMAITYALSGAFPLDASASSTSFTSRGLQLVPVCGDGAMTVVLPDPPPLTKVKLTVDHVPNPPPPGGVVSLTLTTADGTFSVQASAPAPSGGATSVVVSILAPLGVPLVPAFAGAGVASTLTLTGDTTLSMPAQVNGYGTVVDPDSVDLTRSSVSCAVAGAVPSAGDPFPPAPPLFTGPLTGAASPYSYGLLLPQGVSCSLSATLALVDAGPTVGFFSSAPSAFDVAAPKQDFTLPPAGPTVVFHVNTVDARGTKLPTRVRAVSTSLGNGMGARTYATDFNGTHYGTDWGAVLPGVYDLFVSPD